MKQTWQRHVPFPHAGKNRWQLLYEFEGVTSKRPLIGTTARTAADPDVSLTERLPSSFLCVKYFHRENTTGDGTDEAGRRSQAKRRRRDRVSRAGTGTAGVPLYFAMGLVFVLAGLLVDLGGGDDDSGGAGVAAVTVVGVVVLAVMVATHVPYWLRYRQVRKRSTPKWVEWALAAWGAAALSVLGILLNGTVVFAFTLGGIVGAVPSLLWAERLRRTV